MYTSMGRYVFHVDFDEICAVRLLMLMSVLLAVAACVGAGAGVAAFVFVGALRRVLIQPITVNRFTSCVSSWGLRFLPLTALERLGYGMSSHQLET